jgi:RNA polymerase sigma-70 factor, ECF subfamily
VNRQRRKFGRHRKDVLRFLLCVGPPTAVAIPGPVAQDLCPRHLNTRFFVGKLSSCCEEQKPEVADRHMGADGIASTMEDSELFLQAAQNDKKRNLYLGVIFDRYAAGFLQFLQSNGHSLEESEDIVQEVFERLLKKSTTLGEVRQPRAYLWKMVRNIHIDHYRKQGKAKVISVEADELDKNPAPGRSQEFSLYYDCFSSALIRFKSLEPERAHAIELIVLGTLNGHELAEALDRSYGAAREYVSKCRQKLRDFVRSVCGEEP